MDQDKTQDPNQGTNSQAQASLPNNNSSSQSPMTASHPEEVTPPWMQTSKAAEPSKQSQILTETPSLGSAGVDSSQSEFPTSARPSQTDFVKKSPFRKLFPMAALVLLALLFIFLIVKLATSFFKKEESSDKTATGPKKGQKTIDLTYWGLWEPESVMTSLIAEYKKGHPEINIQYSQQSYKDYRERLQSAFARGEGPDIFRFHNTWVPMLKKELAPAPQETAAAIDLKNKYFPVVSSDLTVAGQTVGLPIGFDNLALYYNTTIFNQANKTPPATWEELRKVAKELTVRGSDGKIQTAGIALGTTNNVEHWSDILGLMMLQNGVDLNKPDSELSKGALLFYTIFRLSDKVWDETLPSSVYAFATGKVAMIFAPSWRTFEIKTINPDLEFKTLPIPQLPGEKVSWATYWVEGVWLKSKYSKEAWEFLKFLSSPEALRSFYTASSKVRLFGEPFPRVDMISELEGDPIVSTFVKQGNEARSWYLSSFTWDNGLNDKMIKYFEDAVNAMIQGQTADQVLGALTSGVSQVLSQYGVTASQTSLPAQQK